ncbi:AAA family ATPase [Candidatus Uhrbacteria bacterium]|nr:AAA family ATPase [Candidatus Uhrbacteria bacterium]
MILSISGASGVGKSTMISRLIAETPQSGYLRSTTTRQPRASDAQGEYEFVTDEEFDRLSADNAFAWKTDVAQKRYGTRAQLVLDVLRSDVWHFAALDLSGVRTLQTAARQHGLMTAVRSIYILSPQTETLRRRMRKRGDSDTQIEARLAACASWDTEALHTTAARLEFMRDHDNLDEKLDFARSRILTRR